MEYFECGIAVLVNPFPR